MSDTRKTELKATIAKIDSALAEARDGLALAEAALAQTDPDLRRFGRDLPTEIAEKRDAAISDRAGWRERIDSLTKRRNSASLELAADELHAAKLAWRERTPAEADAAAQAAKSRVAGLESDLDNLQAERAGLAGLKASAEADVATVHGIRHEVATLETAKRQASAEAFERVPGASERVLEHGRAISAKLKGLGAAEVAAETAQAWLDQLPTREAELSERMAAVRAEIESAKVAVRAAETDAVLLRMAGAGAVLGDLIERLALIDRQAARGAFEALRQGRFPNGQGFEALRAFV